MARLIQFQGRTIQVPDDATDDEVRQILSTPASGTQQSSQFSIEQQRALALARARQRREEAVNNPDAVGQAPMAPRFPGVPINGPRFAGTPVSSAAGYDPEAYNDALAAGSAASQKLNLDPTAEPSWMDDVMSGLGWADDTGAIVLDRLGEGAANTLGLPVDAINAAPMLANLVPGIDDVGPIAPNPVGGSEWLNQARKGFGVVPDAPEPGDWVQTLAGRIGEEVGAAALPVAGLVGTGARMGAKVARDSANPFVRAFVAPAAANPAKFIGTETAGATAAGTGAGIANMFVDRETTQGQMADMAVHSAALVSTALAQRWQRAWGRHSTLSARTPTM